MTTASSDETPSRRRPDDEPTRLTGVREWLLLTGNRLVVAGVLLLVVAVTILAAVASGFVPLEVRTPMLFMLFALVSGNFVLITIVVSLNQFVLARHLESPDEIRERMDEMLGYRREVGEASRRTVLPITPAGFLSLLFDTIAGQVRDLQRAIPETGDERAREELRALTDDLERHTDDVDALLERARGGEAALLATLNESYASYIYLAYHVESEHAGALPDGAASLLPDLVSSLEQVDVARRFFKTMFIQSELASLSRLLLYVGVPVQFATVVLMLSFTAPAASDPSTGVLAVVVPTIVVLGFTPIVLLTAFILRLSTVAERTAAMYPFTSEPRGIASLPD